MVQLKAPGATAEDPDLAWHDWIERIYVDLYQQLIKEADDEYNVDLIAPAYEYAVPAKKANGTLDLD